MRLRSEKNDDFWSYRRNIVARCRRKYDRRSSLLAGQRNARWLWVAHTALTMTTALIVCCVSVPRDAAHSADYTVARCSSVRPSVRRHYGVTAKHIIKLFNRRLPHHSSFSLPSGIAIVQQVPHLPEESNAKGVWKKSSLLASLVKHLQSVTRGNCTERTNVDWVSEIFNDAKHRAISLRQLSFLSASVVLGNMAYPNPLLDSFCGQL